MFVSSFNFREDFDPVQHEGYTGHECENQKRYVGGKRGWCWWFTMKFGGKYGGEGCYQGDG